MKPKYKAEDLGLQITLSNSFDQLEVILPKE